MSSPLQLFVDSRFVSPFAMAAYVALKEKAVPFQLTTIDLAQRAQHEPSYASKSLTSKVPMLVHGDFSLSESSAITEYLDEVFPGIALYPKEPQLRARARQIQAWLRTDLMPLRQERSSEGIFLKPTHYLPLSAEATKAADKLCTIAEKLLTNSAGTLFPEWSIADTELALMLNRLVKYGDPISDRLRQYTDEQWKRSSVQSWNNLPRLT